MQRIYTAKPNAEHTVKAERIELELDMTSNPATNDFDVRYEQLNDWIIARQAKQEPNPPIDYLTASEYVLLTVPSKIGHNVNALLKMKVWDKL